MIKLTYNILNKKEKNSFFILLFLFFCTSFLEVLGIGLIYPIINLVFNDTYLENVYFKEYLLDFNFTKFQIIILSLAVLSAVFLFKNLFILFVKYISLNFRKNVELRITRQVISKYLFVNYERVYNRTTEQILKNITFTRDFSSTIFALINIIQEIFIYIFIISLLLVLNSKLVILVFLTSFLIIFIFYFIGRKIFYKLGYVFQKNLQNIYKMIIETVSAIKIIKLIGKESYFLNKIQSKNLKEANIRNKSDIILQIPSHVIEFCSVLCFSIIVIFLAYETNDLTEIISTIAIFAAAITRLMPSSTRMIAYLQTLRYNLPKTKIVYEELYTLNNDEYKDVISKSKNNKKKILFKNKLQFRNVDFYYTNRNKKIFSNFSLEIKKKEFVGIFGPSGSGKSTFNNLLTGLLNPKSGEILVDGINIKENIRNWQNKIGFVSQTPFFSNDTIKNNILFGENPKNIRFKDFDEIIKLSQLKALTDSLPHGVNTTIGEKGINLSTGQLQRISIARALYRKPELLILDEATNALDEENEKLIFNFIKKLKGKITTIIVSHKKDNFYFCDKICKVFKNSFKILRN